MGTKKILGCLAKFWVNGHCLSEKCRNFGVLWASDHVKNGKLFQNVIKLKKNGRFWTKQGPFTQNFAKQPNIFFVPKVLRIIFYP